jgi:predicted TIM-barrel fold metal-dependent hydrolase
MTSEILKRALKRDKFNDLNIIDFHCHLGQWYNFYSPKDGIDSLIEDAERVGVEKICIFPHAAIACDYKLGNLQAAEAMGKYPDKVFAFLTLNANKPEEADAEFEKYYNRPAFIGIKLHPVLHDFSLRSPSTIGIIEKIRKFGGIVLIHTWEGDPRCGIDTCEEVLKEFPDVVFVLAHAGGIRAGVEKSIDLINRYENIYIDTSGFEFSNVWIEEIIEKADSEKIIFGSDYPFHDLRGGLSRILFADLDDGIKKDILGENLRKVLKKYPKAVGIKK